MLNQREKKPVLYSPLTPFFLCAVSGVLINARFRPGVSLWHALLVVAIVAFLLTKLSVLLLKGTRFFRKLRWIISTCLSGAEAWLACSFLSGCFWIWIAACALAGLRHEYYYNCFPENEIGLHVPSEGVNSSVTFRVLKTPTLCEYDDKTRSAFGDDRATLLTGEVFSAKNAGAWEEYSGRIAVSISGDATSLHIGDQVCATGRLTQPARQNNPNERDKAFYYRSQRILAVFRIDSIDNVEILSAAEPTVQFRVLRLLEKIRIKAADVVRERLSKRSASVALGMTLGFRNDVDDDTHEKFRRTGSVHLLAISGLHVMLVIGAIAFLLRAFGLPQEAVCLATLFFVFVYLGLTDMRPPVIRATVIITIMCVGILIGRQGFLLNSLACAALVLLAWNPCELFQPGAQLSFMATGVFLWSDSVTIFDKAKASTRRWEAIKKRRRQKQGGAPHHSFWGRVLLPLWRRISRYSWSKIRGVTLTGAIIWAIGAPLILSVTNLFTPIAIVANPLIWLPATASLLLSFLLEFVGLCSNLGYMPSFFHIVLEALGFVTEKSFELFLGTLDWLSSLEFGVYHLPSPSVLALWLFYGPLVFLTIFPHFRPKRRYIACFATLWCVTVMGFWGVETYANRSKDELLVDVFSVGHGCAVLGRFSDGRTFLYDCGSLENSERAAETVAKNLWDSGRTGVDLVLLSHADFDHYGGMETLLDLVRVKTVCVSPVMFNKENESLKSLHKTLENKHVQIAQVSGGDWLDSLGFPELAIFHPTIEEGDESSAESNSNSVVTAVDYLDRILLLPGDLDSKDAAFIETLPLKCDFVLAPHHGGRSENADELYRWADPTFVGISGGTFLRSYATEDALRENGRRLAHTADDGDIQIQIERDPANPEGQGAFKVSTYKTGRSSVDGTL